MQQLSRGTFGQSRVFASRRNRVVMLAILVISLVLGVASREALASSHNDPVNSCYNTSSLVLRYSDTETCGKNEIAISWPSMSDFIALQAALADEAAQRAAADAALQAALADEATQRAAADAALQAADTALGQQIADEAAQRQAAIAAIQADNAALLQQVAGLQTALDAEIAARQAGDTTLQSALDDEIAARDAGDTQTLTDANAYTDGKYNASIAHTNTKVATEANARAALGDVLWAQITNIIDGLFPELGRAIEAVEGMLSHKIDAAIEGVQGIIENMESTFNGAVTAIQDWLDWLWCNFFSDDC